MALLLHFISSMWRASGCTPPIFKERRFTGGMYHGPRMRPALRLDHCTNGAIRPERRGSASPSRLIVPYPALELPLRPGAGDAARTGRHATSAVKAFSNLPTGHERDAMQPAFDLGVTVRFGLGIYFRVRRRG